MSVLRLEPDRMRRGLVLGTLAGMVAGGPRLAAQQAPVVRVQEGQFRAGAGRITFSELPPNTRNPVYPPSLYRGGEGAPLVRFAGTFLGRRIGTPGSCPPGAAISGCLAGQAARPLSLDPSAPPTFIAFDTAPTINDHQLSGTPLWNGPIAILFDRDQAAVGLTGGFFDAVGATAITVYDRQGTVLGQTANQTTGREFLGLAVRDLRPRIAGLEFHLVGPERAGFGIDNIRFASPEQVELRDNQRAPPPPPPPPQPPVQLPPLLL